MMKRFYKCLFTAILIAFSGVTALKAQDNSGDIILNKDSLSKILNKYAFEGYFLPNRFQATFIDKKNKVYQIPYDETILAFVNLSGNDECKFGLAFGLKGVYINNSNLSTSPGARILKYSLFKNNALNRVDTKEIRVEFTAIEVKKLGKKEQAELEKLLAEIKSKLLKQS